MVPTRPARPARASARAAGAATPQWLLPLMRLMRVDSLPLAQAVRRLPVDPASGARPAMREVVGKLQLRGMLGT